MFCRLCGNARDTSLKSRWRCRPCFEKESKVRRQVTLKRWLFLWVKRILGQYPAGDVEAVAVFVGEADIGAIGGRESWWILREMEL